MLPVGPPTIKRLDSGYQIRADFVDSYSTQKRVRRDSQGTLKLENRCRVGIVARKLLRQKHDALVSSCSDTFKLPLI